MSTMMLEVVTKGFRIIVIPIWLACQTKPIAMKTLGYGYCLNIRNVFILGDNLGYQGFPKGDIYRLRILPVIVLFEKRMLCMLTYVTSDIKHMIIFRIWFWTVKG